jgi:hypothetical protein
MKRIILTVLFGIALAGIAAAQSSVGLGASFGGAFPHGDADELVSDTPEPSFSWGYYVNIPLISSFHIAPSTHLYKLGGENATDIDLAFKFMVPLNRFELYGGFVPGLTTTGETTAPHVGALAGTSFRFVSNLDGFIEGTYSFLFSGNQNLRLFRLGAGLLFRF